MNIHTALINYSKDSELIIGVPDDDSNYFFSPTGCDIINTLATDVVTVKCCLVKRNALGRIIESYDFMADVCQSVLDAHHNGTNYYLNDRGDWIPSYEINDFKKDLRQ